MRLPFAPEVTVRDVSRLGRLVGPERFEALRVAARSTMDALDGSIIWNISSTAQGGGVAEMLQELIGYSRGVGVDARWMVIGADDEFFSITKRLHNRLHGMAGDDGDLGPREAAHYDDVLKQNAAALNGGNIRPNDIVYLHDPQTAGLAGHFKAHGTRVLWRCHIGSDQSNAHTQEAWAFLRPYLAECDTFVFSRSAFVPAQMAEADVWIIEPSIDPLANKNRPLPPARVRSLLARLGVLEGERDRSIHAVVGDASPFPPDAPVVVQVSRWDHLKDMHGVMEGFAAHVAGRQDVRLALVGPAVAGVSDDPEGKRVLDDCISAWEALPPHTRDSIRLITLPMDDIAANALAVNAMQRHARIVVQKSLMEGFGLTITEAMWKARPVIASAVGGIIDQVPDSTGILLPDPTDLTAFGETLAALLNDPPRMRALGRRAKRHVRDHLLSDRHLLDYARVIEHMARR